jgi:hypothetical protein
VVMLYAPLAVAYQQIAVTQPDTVAEAFGS